jgi:16S rRNA (guanine1207-N2)-methyltransferase
MNDPLFNIELRGHALQFQTTWGLFSPKRIDEGTYLLLKRIKLEGNEEILDLGCGYGPIGVTLAKETSGQVTMVDNNFVAVEYAKLNAKQNGTSAVALLSHGLRDIPKDTRFDLVVSNIPAKIGKELMTIFLKDIKKHMNPGGRVVVVTINGLRDYMKRNFKEHFGNYEKIKQGKTYCLASAQL